LKKYQVPGFAVDLIMIFGINYLFLGGYVLESVQNDYLHGEE